MRMPSRNILHHVALAAACVAVVWFYHWTIDSEGGFAPSDGGDYYQLLVRGFRKGHLYMDVEPAPELLALPDPYDPAQNSRYRVPDASYYRDHYYLYFGAA